MLISAAFVLSAQNPANEKELKKQADKRYNDDEFTEAYPLYAQLVANYPKDPLFNFRLGVCMIYSEADKKKCLNYLKAVDPNAKDCPKELFFYLGKAYHINYLFDEALKHYQTFKEKASPSLQKKLQVEREMEACNNGKKLLSNLTDISVRSKKQLNEADYFRTYDLKGLGGKLLVKPEEFRTAVDKKKKERSIVFLPKGSNVVFFSSYGENGANGKDLFSCFKQADGTFSKPVALMGINTGYDEDYPFLHPDGKTLYFASKGFNSMGGYDIFKSVYDSASSTWSSPQNLEFPINSPDDDFLFVTDSLEQTAFFSTGRQSPPGKIDVLKINIARKPLDVIAVKGKVEAEKEGQALNSKIMIKYLNSVRMVGEFEANEEGQFQLQIPNGENLVYTVETPGLSTQSETLIIPKAELARPCRQIIAYQNGKLKISTTFDEGQSEDNYLQYLKVIEEKAKLDVNAEDKSPEPLAKANASENQGPRKKSDGPQIIEQSGPAAANPNNLNNKELAQLVKKDAQQAASQHQQLNQDARDAYKLSGEFSSSYSKKYQEAQTAISNAEAMEEGADKTQAIEMANALKQDAEQDKLLADKILLYGKSLEEDAKTVKLSSDLNNEFASALNKSKSSNIGADPVLSDLQMKVINAENKSGSELYANELRKEISDKEDQIRETDNAIAENTKGTEDIKTEIASLENQLASAKKKSLKENLNSQIGDLRTEQTEKEKQGQDLLTQKTNLEKDLVLLKKENDVLLRIRNENPAAPPAPLVADPATSPLALRDKYSPRIAIVDANDAESYKLSNTALNDYNLEIDALINAKKKESARSRNAKTKQQFAGEIRQLENQKRSNQQQISKNEYLLESLKKQARQEEAIALDLTPISTGDGPEMTRQIARLNKELSFNDGENFRNDTYSDVAAQQLKREAETALKESAFQQNQLMNAVAALNSGIGRSGRNDSLLLHKEADSLILTAQEKRKSANLAKGAEKTKLQNEAKQLEDAANLKLLGVSEIVKADNDSTYQNNNRNIENLIARKKSSPADLAKVRNLLEASNISYKQGQAMREEAASLNSAGAKLGNISNAEEKENEALGKQAEALGLLMAVNPDFQPSLAQTSYTRRNASSGSNDISTTVDSVNVKLQNVVEAKDAAYQKLFEANEAEIASLLTTISANQTLVDNIPALKSQQISAGKKLTEAAVFKSNSEKAAEPSKKLSSLVNATRKQNAAISQLNKLVSDISVAALSGPPPVAVVTPSQTPQVTESTGVAANETSLTATNPGTAAPPLLLLNPDSLVQKDTSTADLLVYLDLQNTGLRNEQAYAASGSALKNLKRIETEQMNIRDNKKNMETLSTMLENTQDPAILRQNADNIDNEAEQTAALALEKRRSAGSAPENEKAGLMAEARALENQSLNQRFLSTLINQKAFDIDYKTNDVALSELKSKLGADNQKLDATQDQLNIDIQNLNAQISKLKEEAAGLPNRSAQLGALSNVDEKEREIIKKQKELIESLRIKYPNYIVNPLSPDTVKAMMQAPQDYSARENELATDQINELTNLTNAFTLEFENSRSQVPAQLSAEQDAVKQNAERLNENSKQLLLEASKESDPAVKAKKMNQAAKLGHAALVQLDALLPASSRKMNSKGSDLASLTEIGNTINQGSPGQENGGDALVIEGLEVVKGNAYSAAKPIPFNAPTEKGLSFRVQIGAFRTQLPNNTFKGLSPVNGETTRTGYFRYTAGNFKKIEQANAVKNDLRKLGYRDAFVVAYLDGKRISASEAISMLNQEGKTVDLNAPQSAGITANVNIAKDILSEQNQTVNPQDLAQVASEIEKINGLFYTIQIGVYSRQATKQSLMNLQPIYTKQLPSGLYRYTAGMYNDSVKVLSDKNRVVEMGISDAFIGAYLNGVSIPYSEARSKQANDPSIRMEAENPIVFPGLPSPASVVPDIKPADPNVKPFTNAVSTYPEATEENGIKNTEDGLSFKVQIGAFSKQVPNDVAARFSQIRNWPIENKQLNGLFVYNIGNFKSARFAKELKDEAVKLGITDAFIVVYLDGKKLYGAEANALLSR